MRTLLAVALTFGLAGAALAAEPVGCDKFKWPVETDRAALMAPERLAAASGSTQTANGKAMTIALVPLDQAALPMPPEKARSTGNFAGFLKIAAPATPGNYTLSMTSGVWIDVIQDGKFLKPSGVTGCDGIRKSMRFDLAAQPFVVQISASAEPSVALLVRPSD